LQQLQQLQQVHQLKNSPKPPNLTPPPPPTASGGSRAYTPNSEIVNITSNSNPSQGQNLSDNVIVNIVDDQFNFDSNPNSSAGQMM
jgi:hypothetical protein